MKHLAMLTSVLSGLFFCGFVFLVDSASKVNAPLESYIISFIGVLFAVYFVAIIDDELRQEKPKIKQ